MRKRAHKRVVHDYPKKDTVRDTVRELSLTAPFTWEQDRSTSNVVGSTPLCVITFLVCPLTVYVLPATTAPHPTRRLTPDLTPKRTQRLPTLLKRFL